MSVSKLYLALLFSFGGCFLLLSAVLFFGCGSQSEERLTLYSGRSEALIGPIVDQFTEATGIKVEVQYESSAVLSNLLLEEGEKSSADLFYSQDPINIQRVAGLLADDLDIDLDLIPPNSSLEGKWYIVSGRLRNMVYAPSLLSETNLPSSIFDFVDPVWDGKLAWAPLNGSFQTMVGIMLNEHGYEKTKSLLNGIKANNPVEFSKNSTMVKGVANGEAQVGLTNHYYALRLIDEFGENLDARNAYFDEKDAGGVNLYTAIGVLNSSDKKDLAKKFVEYLLSKDAQTYIAETNFESPVLSSVSTPLGVPSMTFNTFDDSEIIDLEEVQSLLRQTGIIS